MRTLILVILCCFGVATSTFAHAFVDHAVPAVGSTVHAAPVEVKIWFTEKLVLPFCELRVLDASGAEVDKRDKHLDQGNGELMIVSLPTLKPGKYIVSWRATSEDTHVTTGTFTFVFSP